MPVEQVRTISAYGYRLGGPRAWNLHGFKPGDELRTDWYDETDPTRQFARCATTAARAKLGYPAERPVGDLSSFFETMVAGAERGSPIVGHVVGELPFSFEEALEVSPPGWTREASGPPQLGHNLPADAEVRSLDRVTADQFVLVVADSLFDRDAESVAQHSGEDYHPDPYTFSVGDPDLDWDDTLIAALTILGMEPVGMPDWLWFRSAVVYG
ncbi:hypothetical protein Dvina_52015 [Dactylosporangium vinaceum]|uniref:Uncharacterized protein n=1 Tax=Dactylosporangium vinaceum TaxID=53362 RepID=A0ABV5M2R7_9ACTN|nr:hypothetical protein [Dactylosporangium vinaceum]UAB96362.1 hypothetical protein Dvina_52015 [Dactylosporangium vinaceum]